jgi:chemotaxis protein methyltransferase CheR
MGSDRSSHNDQVRYLLRDLIHKFTGHFFETDRLDRLIEKLDPLVNERGFDSLFDYYYLLKYGQDSDLEWRRVAKALSVNETYFWREYDQIAAAAHILVPSIQENNPGKPVRIWHAASATGEEPYSMAIALTESGAFNRGQIEIIATDFNEESLEKARQAQFRPRSFRSLPDNIRRRYFSEDGKDRMRLVDPLRDRVKFGYLNLADPAQIRSMSNIDIIFCRNVFIYFSPGAIKEVVDQMYRILATPGYLFVASAESLFQITTLFELKEVGGALVYCKDNNNHDTANPFP